MSPRIEKPMMDELEQRAERVVVRLVHATSRAIRQVTAFVAGKRIWIHWPGAGLYQFSASAGRITDSPKPAKNWAMHRADLDELRRLIGYWDRRSLEHAIANRNESAASADRNGSEP